MQEIDKLDDCQNYKNRRFILQLKSAVAVLPENRKFKDTVSWMLGLVFFIFNLSQQVILKFYCLPLFLAFLTSCQGKHWIIMQMYKWSLFRYTWGRIFSWLHYSLVEIIEKYSTILCLFI